MKTLIFLLTFIPVVGIGQLKGYGHIEFVDYAVKITESVYSYPKLSTKAGLKYEFKSITIFSDSEIFSDPFKRGFAPKLSIFNSGFSIKMSRTIKIKAIHTCIHPILSDGQPPLIMLGGGNRVGIYFN